MTDFSVNPVALDAYAKVVGNAGDLGLDSKYLIDAGNYADAQVNLESGAGGLVFQAIIGKVNEVHKQLIQDYSKINSVMIESADGLTTAAQKYRAHDLAAAQKHDAGYKPPGVTPLDFTVDGTASLPDPTSKLVEPSDEGAVPDLAQQILDGCGYASESDLVLKILQFFGLDVGGWVKEKFLGDFKAIARVKSALENLAEFDAEAATDVAEGSASMQQAWSGNAAAAATSYFDQLANALEGHGVALHSASQKVGDVLVSVQQLGSSLEGFITAAIDSAIELGVKLAAAGCLQEVPGVDVLVDIVGASAALDTAGKVRDVIDTWNLAWSGAEGFIALAAGLPGILSSYNVSAKLPQRGYNDDSQGSAPTPVDTSHNMHGPR
jgi:uncharacterized protein YukE